MVGSSHPRASLHLAGELGTTTIDGTDAPVSSEAGPWMTTNGPLLTFDLIRPVDDPEAAGPRGDRT
jgi:hypothetical protein